MSEHPIDTLYGHEFACMMISEHIPFRVEYQSDYVSLFYVTEEHLKEALDLMMKLRGSKL